MKKLMIAAAVAVLGIAANATNVNWGLDAGEALDSCIQTGSTMYFVYTDGDEVDFDVALKDVTKYTETSVLNAIGGRKIDDGEYTGAGAFYQTLVKTTDPLSDLGSGSKDFYCIVIDKDGENLAYGAFSATINNGTTSMTSTLAGSDFGYTSVPEPTSGLLLLLGVAGLALRRRRA